MTAPTIDHDSIALYGGRWQTDRGIQRWVPEPWSPPVRREVDIHDLIACPTCHCRADETCRTRKGLRTNDHANRLIARRCPCGENVAPRCRYCRDCARAAELESKRAARQKLATVTRISADVDEGVAA